MKRRPMACALLCLAGLPLGASADMYTNPSYATAKNTSENNADKVYLGGGVGLSKESDFCDLINNRGLGGCDEGDYSAKAMVGYKINQYLGFEFVYLQADGSTYEASEVVAVAGQDVRNSLEIETSLERYSVDVVGAYPLQSGVNILGRAGYGKNTVTFESTAYDGAEDLRSTKEHEEDSNGAAFAIGASYTWRDLEARLMYERVWKVEALKNQGKTEDSDFTVFGAEILMHFM